MSGGGFVPLRDEPVDGGNATVWARTTFVGFHRWPAPTDHRDYLAALHRHLFHVRVEIEVVHDDREVEFHDLGAVLEEATGKIGERVERLGQVLGAMSCEMICRAVGGYVLSRWPGRRLVVDVSEDAEFGATVVFEATRHDGAPRDDEHP